MVFSLLFFLLFEVDNARVKSVSKYCEKIMMALIDLFYVLHEILLIVFRFLYINV